jgi:hypothetical protein
MFKIKEKFTALQNWIDYGLRCLCFRLSPAGRMISSVLLLVFFGIASIYITVSSIYRIGKRDAEEEFLKVEHIRQLELQQKSDSINQLEITN